MSEVHHRQKSARQARHHQSQSPTSTWISSGSRRDQLIQLKQEIDMLRRSRFFQMQAPINS